MYGKIFASMYEGSMCGSSYGLFAIWNYAIANADADGMVTLNPIVMAAIFNDSVEGVKRMIGELTAPHPESTNQDEEGRRIVHKGGTRYWLVSYARYRAIVRESDRREYERDRKREQRARKCDPRANLSQRFNSNPELSSICPGQARTRSLEEEGEREGEGYKSNDESIPAEADFWNEIWEEKEPERERQLALRRALSEESDGGAVIDFPLIEGEVFEATDSFVALLSREYPGVNVLDEMSAIRKGLISERYKRRDKSLTIAFITKRCGERAG